MPDKWTWLLLQNRRHLLLIHMLCLEISFFIFAEGSDAAKAGSHLEGVRLNDAKACTSARFRAFIHSDARAINAPSFSFFCLWFCPERKELVTWMFCCHDKCSVIPLKKFRRWIHRMALRMMRPQIRIVCRLLPAALGDCHIILGTARLHNQILCHLRPDQSQQAKQARLLHRESTTKSLQPSGTMKGVFVSRRKLMELLLLGEMVGT